MASGVHGAAPGGGADCSGEADAFDEGEYLGARYPDLWGYGLSRERIGAMADVPTDETYV